MASLTSEPEQWAIETQTTRDISTGPRSRGTCRCYWPLNPQPVFWGTTSPRGPCTIDCQQEREMLSVSLSCSWEGLNIMGRAAAPVDKLLRVLLVSPVGRAQTVYLGAYNSLPKGRYGCGQTVRELASSLAPPRSGSSRSTAAR
jgi:hypothetical protein